jgi:hypothetical protein
MHGQRKKGPAAKKSNGNYRLADILFPYETSCTEDLEGSGARIKTPRHHDASQPLGLRAGLGRCGTQEYGPWDASMSVAFHQ